MTLPGQLPSHLLLGRANAPAPILGPYVIFNADRLMSGSADVLNILLPGQVRVEGIAFAYTAVPAAAHVLTVSSGIVGRGTVAAVFFTIPGSVPQSGLITKANGPGLGGTGWVETTPGRNINPATASETYIRAVSANTAAGATVRLHISVICIWLAHIHAITSND